MYLDTEPSFEVEHASLISSGRLDTTSQERFERSRGPAVAERQPSLFHLGLVTIVPVVQL